LAAELDEDRRDKSSGILFGKVLEIEEEIGHVCRPSFGDAFDILDDRRTVVVDNISSLAKTYIGRRT
jgi:hypothetical protein